MKAANSQMTRNDEAAKARFEALADALLSAPGTAPGKGRVPMQAPRRRSVAVLASAGAALAACVFGAAILTSTAPEEPVELRTRPSVTTDSTSGVDPKILGERLIELLEDRFDVTFAADEVERAAAEHAASLAEVEEASAEVVERLNQTDPAGVNDDRIVESPTQSLALRGDRHGDHVLVNLIVTSSGPVQGLGPDRPMLFSDAEASTAPTPPGWSVWVSDDVSALTGKHERSIEAHGPLGVIGITMAHTGNPPLSPQQAIALASDAWNGT